MIYNTSDKPVIKKNLMQKYKIEELKKYNYISDFQ